jgi:hypothetical protein
MGQTDKQNANSSTVQALWNKYSAACFTVPVQPTNDIPKINIVTNDSTSVPNYSTITTAALPMQPFMPCV